MNVLTASRFRAGYGSRTKLDLIPRAPQLPSGSVHHLARAALNRVAEQGCGQEVGDEDSGATEIG